MKKIKKRFNVVKIKKPEVLGKYNSMIILSALFIAGLIAGAMIIRQNDSYIMGKLDEIFISFHSTRAAQTMPETFANSILVNLSFLISAFFFGMSCIGLPFVCIIPILRGLAIGLSSGYLYMSFGLQGIGFFTLTILPGAVIAVTMLLISCNESLKTSVDLFRMLVNNGGGDSKLIKRYLSVYIIIISLTLLSGVIDMLAVKLFSALFALGIS